MDPDRPHDDPGLSPEPTITSVLGLSGPLRFRLHGSTQKAHLLLKQSDEKRPPGEPSSTNGVVYYSLYAQKRIEVKPGKEILLALEGKFGDRPVLICGNVPSSGHDPTHVPLSTPTVEEVATKVEPTKPSRTASPMPMREATPNLPPKLRKAWMKSMQNRQPVERAFSPSWFTRTLLNNLTSSKTRDARDCHPDRVGVYLYGRWPPSISIRIHRGRFSGTGILSRQHRNHTRTRTHVARFVPATTYHYSTGCNLGNTPTTFTYPPCGTPCRNWT